MNGSAGIKTISQKKSVMGSPVGSISEENSLPKPMTNWPKLRRWISSHPGKAGAVAGWYQQACTALVTMVSYPLVIRHLSEANAGIWFSFQGLLAAINLTDFGLSFVLA